MKSRKSESGSKRVPKLNRTLKRKVITRPFTRNDVRYLWATRRKDVNSNNINPNEFTDEMVERISSQYDESFIIEAYSMNKVMPVGVVFCTYSGPLLFINDTTWFPWASKRNKIEGSVGFFNEIRRAYISMLYSEMKDKKFYEFIAKHGIIRRVGTIYDLFESGPATLFQTRVPK